MENQVAYAAALAHKDVCLGIGLTASAGAVARRAGIATIYDESCKKISADRSAAGEIGFDVNQLALVVDATLLKQAEDMYDSGAKGVSKGGVDACLFRVLNCV